MKHPLLSLLLVSSICSIFTFASTAIAQIDQQKMETQLEKTEEELEEIQKNVATFKECVLKGTCSSETQRKLSTALKGSAATLGILVLSLLAAEGAKRSERSPKLDNPIVFYHAILVNDIDLVQRILDAKLIDIDAPLVLELTPLATAVRHRQRNIIRLLLDKGALNILDEETQDQIPSDIKELLAKYPYQSRRAHQSRSVSQGG